MVASALNANAGLIAKAVDKKFGAGGRCVLRQVQSVEDVTMGEVFKPMSSRRDFKSVGTLYARILKMFGVDIEVKVKKAEAVIEVLNCPYGLEGTSRELCEAMIALDVGVVKTMSPNVNLEIAKRAAVGDPQCKLSITPKK